VASLPLATPAGFEPMHLSYSIDVECDGVAVRFDVPWVSARDFLREASDATGRALYDHVLLRRRDDGEWDEFHPQANNVLNRVMLRTGQVYRTRRH
jgi:hypothetical protein